MIAYYWANTYLQEFAKPLQVLWNLWVILELLEYSNQQLLVEFCSKVVLSNKVTRNRIINVMKRN